MRTSIPTSTPTSNSSSRDFESSRLYTQSLLTDPVLNSDYARDELNKIFGTARKTTLAVYRKATLTPALNSKVDDQEVLLRPSSNDEAKELLASTEEYLSNLAQYIQHLEFGLRPLNPSLPETVAAPFTDFVGNYNVIKQNCLPSVRWGSFDNGKGPTICL